MPMVEKPKNKKLIWLIIAVIVIGGFMLGSLALAATIDTGIQFGTYTGLGSEDIRVTIMNVVRVALGFLGVLAILLILYGGFVWMTAGGNAERVDTAKRILVNAVIG